jgi:hypothetical protein
MGMGAASAGMTRWPRMRHLGYGVTAVRGVAGTVGSLGLAGVTEAFAESVAKAEIAIEAATNRFGCSSCS